MAAREHELGLTVRPWTVGEIEIGVSSVQHLGQSVRSGTFKLDRDPIFGVNGAALEGNLQAVGLAGFEVPERDSFSMAARDRQRPRRGRSGRRTARTSLNPVLGREQN